eukprot:scaffold218291_cov34-Prasinocladus_malaysianus.AAC.1
MAGSSGVPSVVYEKSGFARQTSTVTNVAGCRDDERTAQTRLLAKHTISTHNICNEFAQVALSERPHLALIVRVRRLSARCVWGCG